MIKSANLFIHPWAFADEGLGQVLDTISDLGITCLHVASLYHAGYFLYGHNPKRKVHLLEDGVCYYQPRESHYQDCPSKPALADITKRQANT